MAQIIYYHCDNCDFKTSIFYRQRTESMLNGEGPSTYYCYDCKKEVKIYSDEETICPYCKGHNFIGCSDNTSDEATIYKCPYCGEDLVEEEGPAF
ncbi:MAG: zinc-ribbon domain-containing protein [Patescibacteria group bacterium]|nr:zinc-ribbon domain-containing protein [Patescibacteria group bacterium]